MAQVILRHQDEEGFMQASPCLPLKKTSTVMQSTEDACFSSHP